MTPPLADPQAPDLTPIVSHRQTALHVVMESRFRETFRASYRGRPPQTYDDLVPSIVQTDDLELSAAAANIYNHHLWWESLAIDKPMRPTLRRHVASQWTSEGVFFRRGAKLATRSRGGWLFLCTDASGVLRWITTRYDKSIVAIPEHRPLAVLDLAEHAFMLDAELEWCGGGEPGAWLSRRLCSSTADPLEVWVRALLEYAVDWHRVETLLAESVLSREVAE